MIKKPKQMEWQIIDNKSHHCRKMKGKDQVPHCIVEYQTSARVVQQNLYIFWTTLFNVKVNHHY